MIKCPDTGRAVSTGIEVERTTFIQLPDVKAPMTCSACGRQHWWSKDDAWVADQNGDAPRVER